jgi:hypothetical protein
MSGKTERRFYASNGSPVDEANAFIGVESVYHAETVNDVCFTKVERKAWLISEPSTVHQFKNRKSLNDWIANQVNGAQGS